MKKIYLILITVLLTSSAYCQDSYKTKSGHVFKVGDTIRLGQPVVISSGLFLSTTGHWETLFSERNESIQNMNFINKKAIISKIDLSGDARLLFKLFGKKLNILVDDGISLGEIAITDTNLKNNIDKYDMIKKIQTLLNTGAITQEEFESEKKKLLSR